MIARLAIRNRRILGMASIEAAKSAGLGVLSCNTPVELWQSRGTLRAMRILGVFLALAWLSGCVALAQLPQGAIPFGVLGDTPYSLAEVERLDRLIDDINAHELAFVVHVGDIGTTTQACNDEWLEARKRQFGRIRQPFVLLPG